MKITVMGTGGVGGYFGGRLAAAGHDVTFVARGEHLAAMRRDGLYVESPGGELRIVDATFTDDPAEGGVADIVLFGVKLWDTESAAESLQPALGPDTGVISFQNGVAKDDLIGKAVGEEHVVGGVCYIAAMIKAPGAILNTGTMQKLVFGEYSGTQSARLQALHDACVDASIDVEMPADIGRTIWEKFVFLSGMSASTTTVRSAIGPIRENVAARAYLHDLMDETVQVARAEGVQILADYAQDQLTFIDGLPATMTSSMHNDLERGSRLEVNWLSGEVVERGRRLGIPTPSHEAAQRILAIYSGGRTS